MYTSFYKLRTKPFQISSDPAFMWFGEKHQEALATLRYGILDNKGFLLLTGDVGTGKTSLINTLVKSLGEDVIWATVPDPSLEKMDFFNYIAAAFGIGREFLAKGAFLAHFREFLLEAAETGKKVLLIIDEAQLLTQEILEEIRLLSNIEKADAKLINIFFIGQNEFNEILNRPQNRAVRQRLTLNYNLDPLTPDETEAYIRHRLKIAGSTEPIFGLSAVQEVFLYSGGFPRRINILCDHALLSGYVKEQKVVDAVIVRECARELKIPAHVPNRDINGFTDSRPPRKTIPRNRDLEAGPVIRPAPSAQPRPKPRKREKTSNPWPWILALILFFAFAWMFMFPDHFRSSVLLTGQRLAVLKENILPLLPEALRPLAPVPARPEPEPVQQPIFPLDQNLPAQPDPPLDEEIRPDILVPAEKKTPEPDLIKPEPRSEDSGSRAAIEKEIQIKPIPETIVPDMEQDSGPPLSAAPGSGTEFKGQHFSRQRPVNPYLNEKPEIDPPLTGKIPDLPSKKIIVRFKYNTNDFTPDGLKELESFSRILSLHTQARIRITGYTDSEGYDKYNQKLSEFRANIVKSFLMGKGIGQDQIQIRGLGGENPIETNSTAWGRMMNRRVEIEVMD